jgi:hypothetical protein
MQADSITQIRKLFFKSNHKPGFKTIPPEVTYYDSKSGILPIYIQAFSGQLFAFFKSPESSL